MHVDGGVRCGSTTTSSSTSLTSSSMCVLPPAPPIRAMLTGLNTDPSDLPLNITGAGPAGAGWYDIQDVPVSHCYLMIASGTVAMPAAHHSRVCSWLYFFSLDHDLRLDDSLLRGGKICLTDHFNPLWARNVPHFGIAHALCLGVPLLLTSSSSLTCYVDSSNPSKHAMIRFLRCRWPHGLLPRYQCLWRQGKSSPPTVKRRLGSSLVGKCSANEGHPPLRQALRSRSNCPPSRTPGRATARWESRSAWRKQAMP